MEMVLEGYEQGLDPSYYYGVLKKRILFLLVPFVVVLAGGTAAAVLWPPTYLSEGKILVESQQIPTDLVRPTVTASARERIEVIQQRVMTRDNLLAIVDKYQMFADRRERLSRTELLDLMRESTRVEPIEFADQMRGRKDTIALTVGFMHERADVAARVANELLTLFLNEDARNRTNRAMETTKFLAREAQRLEGELGAVEAKISEAKRQQGSRLAIQPVGGQLSPLAALRAEFAQKAAIYSKSHPELKRLQAQIAALEKVDVGPLPTEAGAQAQPGAQDLDGLETQRKSIQNGLETASQKLAAARLGENLERDQFSERLEVIEQAVLPQKPIKPNRPKLLSLAFFAAVMAGAAGIVGAEIFDKTIRGSQDLFGVADSHLVVTIPYISTRAELVRKRTRAIYVIGILLAAVLVSLIAVHFLIRPLDELWTILLRRVLP